MGLPNRHVTLLNSNTLDTGKELAGWREIATKYDLHTYFAKVGGAPNQRGYTTKIITASLRRDGLSKKLRFSPFTKRTN